MARKQVEGHASKQAPANRTIYHSYVVFEKHEMHDKHRKTTRDWNTVMKWLNNGNTVNAVILESGFEMKRHAPNIDASRTEICGRNPLDVGCESLSPTARERVYRTWNRKLGQMPTKKELNHLAKVDDTFKQVCTF